MRKCNVIITIDGPTASGKSTVARYLAQELHFFYLSSGLLYRALAYVLITKKQYTYTEIAVPNEQDVDAVFNALQYTHINDTDAVLYDGHDITYYLKDAAIDKGSSIVSTYPYVRQQANKFQRYIAEKTSIVVDGRDTGSVVFPNADYKFFLTASLDVRAKRWQLYQEAKGKKYTLEQAYAYLQERDERDATRVVDPLCIPQNAIIIDNSALFEQQTLEAMKMIVSCHNT